MKKNKIILITTLLILVSCSKGLTAVQPTSTQSEWEVTGTANAISYWATKTAMPTSTKAPTKVPTKDTRTDLEKAVDKCANIGLGVRYVIESDGVSAVSLTLENDSNGTEQGDYSTPYCRMFTNFNSGDFLYISAQIILPTSSAGSITCKIYDGSKVISQSFASGYPSIATCSTSKP